MAPREDLYLLPISPWSRRVLLVLRHTKCSVVRVREYHVFLTAFLLRLLRKIERSTKVTAPLLLKRDGDAVMDGEMIARFLDAQRAPGVSTLFPPEHDTEIRELLRAAETLARFWRRYIFEYLSAHPELCTRLYLPRFLWWIPGISKLAISLNESLVRKFTEESQLAETEIRDSLEVVSQTVSTAGSDLYLVGGNLTYVDMAVALALPFVHPASSHWQGIPDHVLGEEYASVKEWGYRFCGRHVRTDDVAFPYGT